MHAGQTAAMLVALWAALGNAILQGRDGDSASPGDMQEAEALLDDLLPL